MRALIMTAVTAAALAAAPAAAMQAPNSAAPAAPVSQAQLTRAKLLVSLINPEAMMIQKNMEGWEAAFVRTLELTPSVATLEAAYPGASKAALAAARPIASEYSREFVRKMLDDKARLFAERLTLAELETAIAFFESPAGRRFIANLLGNFDMAGTAEKVASKAVRNGDVTVEIKDLAQMQQSAAVKTAREISAEDQIAMMRFSQTEAGKKLARAGEEADRRAMETINNPDPDWVQRQGEAANAAIVAFVDARQKS